MAKLQWSVAWGNFTGIFVSLSIQTKRTGNGTIISRLFIQLNKVTYEQEFEVDKRDEMVGNALNDGLLKNNQVISCSFPT